MKRIITTFLTGLCVSTFALVDSPIEHTKKIVAANSADDVDLYISLTKTAMGDAAFQQMTEEQYGSLEKFRGSVEQGFAQRPPYDADTFWITDDFEEAFQKTSHLKVVFGGKKLKQGYKIVMYGDKSTSAFILYQTQGEKWVLKDYPTMGEGLFVEE